MATTTGIGKITAALEAGKAAFAAMDTGPAIYSDIDFIADADWQYQEEDLDTFLFGTDKWGSTSKKVGS